LIIDELRLAEALSAIGDLDAARTAVSRCLGILRQGAPQGHLWRSEALIVAINIDVSLASATLPIGSHSALAKGFSAKHI
jgi:hypothetical protein